MSSGARSRTRAGRSRKSTKCCGVRRGRESRGRHIIRRENTAGLLNKRRRFRRETRAIRTPQMDPMAPPSAIKETYHPEGAYVVRWASSQTVQHAMLRDAELHGGGNSPAEDRL